jgi:hypothetical protein
MAVWRLMGRSGYRLQYRRYHGRNIGISCKIGYRKPYDKQYYERDCADGYPYAGVALFTLYLG